MIATSRLLIVIGCLIVHLASLVCFLYGFFPTSAQLTPIHRSKFINNLTFAECNRSKNLTTSDQLRVVLLVIDALRADFLLEINGSRMKFLRKTIDDGQYAEAYTAIVQSPTVTMPRIKAITAGVVPAFVDFALNLASAEFLEDNILTRMKFKSDNMTFFGDDTWLRLFPGHFTRFDGTTSFLVTDFYEVDNNITRHLDDELTRNDWRLMIMHYLGLDHIGHNCGPFCHHLITPKLVEMDEIVKKVFTTLQQVGPNFVLIILGDHGMSDMGSHGGSSPAETTVPLIFLSPLLAGRPKSDEILFTEIQQVSLASTLAVLLGVPVPKRNVGVMLDVVENFVDDPFELLAIWRNSAHQLINLHADRAGDEDVHAEFVSFEKILNLHNTFVNKFCSVDHQQNPESAESEAIVGRYKQFANNIQVKLMNSYNYYDVPWIIYSFLFCLSSIFGMILVNLQLDNKRFPIHKSPFFYALLIHSASFLSTSLIEEEHQTFYFLWPSLITTLFWRCLKKKSLDNLTILNFFIVFSMHRIAREWNRTGDKWKHLEDIGDILSKPENVYTLTALSLLCISIGSILISKRLKTNLSKITFNVGICFVICYRYQSDWCQLQAIWEARCVYLSALILLLQLKNNFGSTIGSFYLLSLILVKSYNVPLLTVVIFLALGLTKICYDMKLRSEEKLTMYYFTMACSYFYLGRSNNIGNIDVSCGYVGLLFYNPALVSVLMTAHFYCGPILVCLIFIDDNEEDDGVEWSIRMCTMKNVSTVFYLLLAFIQRYHLFIWSVFAPKLLYESFHSAFMSVVTILVCFYALLKTSI